MRTIRPLVLVLTGALTAGVTASLPAGAQTADGATTIVEQAVDPDRSAELVVLTGDRFPAWSVPAATGQPATYPSGSSDDNPFGDEVRSAHNGTLVGTTAQTGLSGIDSTDLVAYRVEDGAWTEVPVQVDERFPYFLANGRSDFGFYSGTDTELTYAWGGDGVHTTGEEAWKKVAGEVEARYPSAAEIAALQDGSAPSYLAENLKAIGQGESLEDYTAPSEDPVVGLDHDDEIAFMAADAGESALDTPDPAGVDAGSRHEVALADPITGELRYLYLFTRDGGSRFTHTNGYVLHERSPDADRWVDRNSWADDDPEVLSESNTGYGANLHGPVHTDAVGTTFFDAETPRSSDDRFPVDAMTISTDRYRLTASGRWMLRGMQIADPDEAPTTPGTPLAERLDDRAYGDDLVDRWKGRAFQQSPDSQISLVGFEDEQVNWEANASLLGWRSGPVRTIREIWGADSGTNVTKTETFTRGGVNHRYRVRVHPIPPDGLYTSWDYNRETVACYFNAVTVGTDRVDESATHDGLTCEGGVAIDGRNDENVGNFDGFDVNLDGSIDFPAYFDAPDPTLDLPVAFDRWEQVAGTGRNGSLVYMFELEGGTSLENPLIVPYYRDDACLDDGTGDDPTPRPYPGEASTDPEVYGDVPCDLDENATTRQGAHGAHGVHFFLTGDTDNGFVGTAAPTTEIDGSQWQIAVPQDAPTPVGEAIAQSLRVPLVATVTAQPSPSDDGDPAPGQLRAGAAKIDATWHVGAAAGQYAGKNVGMIDYHDGLGFDPGTHSVSSEASYGVQGRDFVRALVVEGGPDDARKRHAIVSNDLYIPQAMVNERVAQILAEHDARVAAGLEDGPTVGIGIEELTVSVSHSHSSPYYSTTAAGVWAFEDVFDIRFFEHIADKMADAIIAATGELQPATLGAAESQMHLVKSHSYGPEIGENSSTSGTPAGYHRGDNDHSLSVIAVDTPQGAPIATWVVWGLHPEFLDGVDLLASEWQNTTMRILDRTVGGVTVFSQKDVGSSETQGEHQFHPEERVDYFHRGYAEIDRASRLIAEAVSATRAHVREPDASAVAIPTGRRGEPVITLTDRVAARDTMVVDSTYLQFAPPGAQPTPEVSNCNTEPAEAFRPGVPVVGLPDCYEFPENPISEQLAGTVDPRVTEAMLEGAGVPVPDDYGAPSVVALEESAAVRLQAIRLGDIAVTVCPCEQFADQSRNITSRLERDHEGFFYGFDWTANDLMSDSFQPGLRYDGQDGRPLQAPISQRAGSEQWVDAFDPAAPFWCVPLDAAGNRLTLDPATGDVAGETAPVSWQCRDPEDKPNPWLTGRGHPWLTPVSDHVFRTWKAQLYNDAAGWDELVDALGAESEPTDPSQIKGNFTHETLQSFMDGDGYEMVLPVGMTNDYFGYIVSYREFRAHDHYRKALTGLGPHAMDFLATRLSRMAAALKGSTVDVGQNPKDLAYQESEGRRVGLAAAGIGALATIHLPAYESRLPADGGAPRITDQPAEIGHFEAAELSFVGGSNYTDTPNVIVERQQSDGSWLPYATSEGEVAVRVDFPDLDSEEVALSQAGAYEWQWTASFEAHASDIALPDATGTLQTVTPPGNYRFVVEGCHRGLVPSLTTLEQLAGTSDDPACLGHDLTGRVQPYQLVSEPFAVAPWKGVTTDLAIDTDDRVSFAFGPTPEFNLDASNMDVLHDAREGDADLQGAVNLPDTYSSSFPYVSGSESYKAGERFCHECSFRPWADTDRVTDFTVLVTNLGGQSREVPVAYDAERNRWVIERKVPKTWTVTVTDIVTSFGFTGASATISPGTEEALTTVRADASAMPTSDDWFAQFGLDPFFLEWQELVSPDLTNVL